MAETLNARETLFKAVLDAYRGEYGELYQTWRNLETKAQGNAAIAGIFLAGLFAFVSDIAPQPPWWQKTLLVVSGCALGLSVLFAALVLAVRTRWSPQVGRNIEALATDLNRLDDDREVAERLPAFISDQVDVWKNGVTELQDLVHRKARNLRLAQLCLAFGVVAIVFVTLLNVVHM